MEEMGMTDLQYKDHLRSVIAEFENLKKMGVGEQVEAEIDEIIARYTKAVED